jgi:hypothetical protein
MFVACGVALIEAKTRLLILRLESAVSGAMPTALRGHVSHRPMPTQSPGHGTHELSFSDHQIAQP